MNEKPIIFSAPMVRSILAGGKTQTRRIVKPGTVVAPTMKGVILSPYGQPGDRLWVRETFACLDTVHGLNFDEKPLPENCRVIYRATQGDETCISYDDDGNEIGPCKPPWKPSIHMPRWASRINLLIKSVRFEQLQDISKADAKAEGVDDCAAYAKLWNEINGACTWEKNRLVWVVEFERVT